MFSTKPFDVTIYGQNQNHPTPKFFINPTTAPHSLPLPEDDGDDDKLLVLASKVNPAVTATSRKKIAFMFLTNAPLPFAPLWELFFSNQTNEKKHCLFNIYVHVDPTAKYDRPFSGVFSNRVIRSKPTHRFSPTLSSAARRLLANELLHDPSNYMFALLSPSCITLHSFEFPYRTLTRSRKSFIEILKDEPWAHGRWAARGEEAMLPEVTLEEFKIGSQFWVLTRKHAGVVVGDREIWPKFNRTCVQRYTCYPEENYFPTLIHKRDPEGSVSATLTHVDWRRSTGGHPRLYRESEVGPHLIMRLRNAVPRYGDDDGKTLAGISQRNYRSNGSVAVIGRRVADPFLFARKFSADSIGPLMSIAREVILKE